MTKQTRALAAAVVFLALAIAAAIAAKLWLNPAPKTTVSAPVNTSCDLQAGTCSSSLPDGGRIELTITPRPIPLLQPLQVTVRLDGLEAKMVEVDFAGVDMNMGFNRHPLQRLDDGRYTGTTVLPVCITGRMAWQASVIVSSAKATVVAPFRFITSRNQ